MSDERAPLTAIARPASLAQVAYDRIRQGLMPGGELDTTDRLVEQELAVRLAMSRTPVRDALHRLALMGFLEPSGAAGYVRRSFTARDAREHYELRRLLEPWAAEVAAQRDDPSRRRAIRETLRPVATGPRVDHVRFHVGIAALAGNQAMVKVISAINERLASFGVFITAPMDAKRLADDHEELLERIRRGDPEGARALMYNHLVFTEQAVVRELARLDQADGGAEPERVAAPRTNGDSRA
jgi:DNA-binding GntR family transcriptional regulator